MQEKDGFLRWSEKRWWRVSPESQRQKVAHALQYRIRISKGENDDSSVGASPCEETKERNDLHMEKLVGRDVHLESKIFQPTPTERHGSSVAQAFFRTTTLRPKMDVEPSLHKAMACNSKHPQASKRSFHQLTHAAEETSGCSVLKNGTPVDAAVSIDGRDDWRQDVSFPQAKQRKRSTDSSHSPSACTLSHGTAAMPHFVVVSSSWELSRQWLHPPSDD